MKKIVILLIPFLLTGCFFGETGKGNLTTTCTKGTPGPLEISQTMNIHFNNNKVDKVEILEQYKIASKQDSSALTSIIETLSTRNTNLKSAKGLEITVLAEDEEKYEVKYFITMEQLSDKYLSEFSVSRDYTKQIKILEEAGMTCK